MNILQKIKTLGEAASYDTVCGSPRSTGMANKSLKETVNSFIYKSRSENYDCRLLKILMTNKCSHDCKYCVNRCGKQKKITAFQPQELAGTFNALRRKGLVNGLFLSSGIAKDADRITEQMIEGVRLLRHKYFFKGYIHFKILPGVSKELVKQAAELSTRMSINLETPSKERLNEVSSTKDFRIDILRRQSWIKKLPLSGGQTTQLIVGSAGEDDWEILKTVDYEHKEFNLRRFYFSAFSPVKHTPFENKQKTPVLREQRLYNVEFMLREYKFSVKDFKLILDDNDMLPSIDPKVALANELMDGPVDVNEADYDELLRVPGIGPKTASRICYMRTKNKIKRYEELHKMGIAVKRAKPYIKVNSMWQKSLRCF